MTVPVLAISLGVAGIVVCVIACLIALWPAATDPAPIPPSQLNKDIDLARYQATDDAILFLAKGLSDHPFKIGDGGVFCSVCLINQQIKLPNGPVMVHDHECTVIRKDWKIVICRSGGQAEYFISLDRPFLRRGR